MTIRRAALAFIGLLAIAGIYGSTLDSYISTGAHEAAHCWISANLQGDGRLCYIRIQGTEEPLVSDGMRAYGTARMGLPGSGPQTALLWWEHPAIAVLEVVVLTGMTLPFALLTLPALLALTLGPTSIPRGDDPESLDAKPSSTAGGNRDASP